jgi:hypothetical protein
VARRLKSSIVPRPRPDHAFQRTAAVDAVLLVSRHLFLLLLPPKWPNHKETDSGRDLFPAIGGARQATRAAHRRKRERKRKPCEGMMLHLDGSRAARLANQPMLDLIV